MFRKLLLVFLFSVVTLKGSISFTSNVISSTGEKDTIEVKAEGYVKEAERIFKETENDIEERRSRISQFTSKVTKVLSTPFTKALTKVTLIQMEVICSAMPDLESAGFSVFPQAFILLEVLGEGVDSGLMSKAIKNKRNDWKFRRLIAEIIGDLCIKNAKDPMMEVILDGSDNKWVRSRCIFEVPTLGDTYQGEPIGNYLMEIFKEEEGLREDAARALGYLQYKPAIDLLLEYIEEDTSKMSRVIMLNALGDMGDKRAFQGMFTLMKDKELKGYVVKQLGKIGGEEVVDTLIHIFKNDKDSFVRYCAGKGLALSGNDRAYEFLINRKAVGVLGEAAIFGDRMKALDALKEIGTPGALKKLRWLSTKGSSASAKIRERAKVLVKELESEGQ